MEHQTQIASFWILPSLETYQSGIRAQSQEATHGHTRPKPRRDAPGASAAALSNRFGCSAIRIKQFKAQAIVHIKIYLRWNLVRPREILDFQIDRRGKPGRPFARLVVDLPSLIDRDACAELVSMAIIKSLGPLAGCDQIGDRWLHE